MLFLTHEFADYSSNKKDNYQKRDLLLTCFENNVGSVLVLRSLCIYKDALKDADHDFCDNLERLPIAGLFEGMFYAWSDLHLGK